MRTCRPTVGSAPSRLVTSPRRHSGPSSTNISRRRLPGPRNGLVGHRRRSRPTSPTAIHKSRAVALVVLKAGTAGLKHLPDSSIGTVDLVKLKLLHWGSEKREDHVPHVIFFEDTLFTHASFAHQCVFTTGTAGSRQGHPATWQAHSHSGTLKTAGGPGFYDSTH